MWHHISVTICHAELILVELQKSKITNENASFGIYLIIDFNLTEAVITNYNAAFTCYHNDHKYEFPSGKLDNVSIHIYYWETILILEFQSWTGCKL